jgi:NADH-quinone oxidoreductase subunit M
MAPLVGLIVFLGVFPKPMLERIEPSVERLVEHVEDHSDFRVPEAGREGATDGDAGTDDHATEDGGH